MVKNTKLAKTNFKPYSMLQPVLKQNVYNVISPNFIKTQFKNKIIRKDLVTVPSAFLLQWDVDVVLL